MKPAWQVIDCTSSRILGALVVELEQCSHSHGTRRENIKILRVGAAARQPSIGDIFRRPLAVAIDFAHDAIVCFGSDHSIALAVLGNSAYALFNGKSFVACSGHSCIGPWPPITTGQLDHHIWYRKLRVRRRLERLRRRRPWNSSKNTYKDGCKASPSDNHEFPPWSLGILKNFLHCDGALV